MGLALLPPIDKQRLSANAISCVSKVVKAHAFASGNRRTAYAVTKEFLLHNKARIHDLKGNIEAIMKGIRKFLCL